MFEKRKSERILQDVTTDHFLTTLCTICVSGPVTYRLPWRSMVTPCGRRPRPAMESITLPSFMIVIDSESTWLIYRVSSEVMYIEPRGFEEKPVHCSRII